MRKTRHSEGQNMPGHNNMDFVDYDVAGKNRDGSFRKEYPLR